MIAVVRARTLNALRTSLAEAQEAAKTAREEAEQHKWSSELATDSAIRAETALEKIQTTALQRAVDAAHLEGELETLRAQSLLDTEDRQALRTLLRITRKQNSRADRVYVLFRFGELHSVHVTRDAAEIAAETEGASRDGWFTPSTHGTVPAAAEVSWCIRPVQLGCAP
ncbi:hypothetical protein OOK13_19415 [Streptomyces sp. NBC_00378]|uniref:hypothetical protein n=1 Tax=Streptomyces sp. NBC_00378 TaxID=2975732 RepID=UPI00224FA698|nr:hypothetical protein [Streptomyces sp. NBC_00378]MCX5110673.1 hypothetical protein [Streptomyces sp. NBC_00378]